MKCKYIDECPSVSDWCSDRSEENDCLTFLLTANENLKDENKQLKEKFKKAMKLLGKAIDDMDEFRCCQCCRYYQGGTCYKCNQLYDKWEWRWEKELEELNTEYYNTTILNGKTLLEWALKWFSMSNDVFCSNYGFNFNPHDYPGLYQIASKKYWRE